MLVALAIIPEPDPPPEALLPARMTRWLLRQAGSRLWRWGALAAQRIMSPARCGVHDSAYRERPGDYHCQMQYGRIFLVAMRGEGDRSP